MASKQDQIQLPASVEQIENREQALRMLEHLAAWFRQAEPHSPISYSLQQLARYGRMPLPELLNHLIPDGQARNTFLNLSAMESPEDQVGKQ